MTWDNAADLLLIIAPFVGFIINVMAQLVLARLVRVGLLSSIFVAFIFGGMACFAVLAIALAIQTQPLIDKLALSAAVLIVYGASEFVLFAVINLGETSLRIHQMQLLLERPDGLTATEILSRYDDALYQIPEIVTLTGFPNQRGSD